MGEECMTKIDNGPDNDGVYPLYSIETDGMARFWDEQAEWSQATFGTDQERGPLGPLKHLEKEAREAIDELDPARRHVEIVDCLFLTVDAARRSGLTYDRFLQLANEKLAINKARRWGAKSGDEPTEHIRDGENGSA